jgi:hypothetical protein
MNLFRRTRVATQSKHWHTTTAERRYYDGISMKVESYIPNEFHWTIFCEFADFRIMASGGEYENLDAAQTAADEAMRKLYAAGAHGRPSGK